MTLGHNIQNSDRAKTDYASFWKRAAANIIDFLILYAVLFILVGLGDILIPSIDPDDFFDYCIISSVIMTLIGCIYFISMEMSAKQGTIGKLLVGIKVIDANGNRIRFTKAIIRCVGKILTSPIVFPMSYLILAIFTMDFLALPLYLKMITTLSAIVSITHVLGVALIVFSTKKQSLYDMISESFVINNL